MEANEEPAYNLIDISIKRLVRDNPAAFLELIGFNVAPNHVTFEDTAIQQLERRADHTCILTDDNGERRGVIYTGVPDGSRSASRQGMDLDVGRTFATFSGSGCHARRVLEPGQLRDVPPGVS